MGAQRKKQEKEARKQRMAKEAKERQNKRKKQLKGYKDLITDLKNQISSIDNEKAEFLLSISQRESDAKKMQDEYNERLNNMQKDGKEGKKIIKEKKAIIEFNKKEMINLKQEHKKLGKSHARVS